jgi:hypothetical protein
VLQECPDDGNPGGTGSLHLRHAGGGHPSDGHNRHRRPLASRREGRETLGGSVLALGRRVVDRTEEDEVRAPAAGGLRFRSRVRRDSEEALEADQPAGGLGRQAVGGQMQAVGADGQRDVGPVVDEEPGAVTPGQRAQLARELKQLRGRQVLLAELDGTEAGRQALLHHAG